MKTCKNLLPGLVSAFLLTLGLTGCQDYDIPAANTQLSYPAGEMALGGGTYTSAQPTVRSAPAPRFSITRVTHNGTAAELTSTAIDPSTGVISITPGSDISALGTYLVSVEMHNDDGSYGYPDAFRLVVKGIVFDSPAASVTRGETVTIPVKEAYLVQQEGTVFRLAAPKDNPDYDHFRIDTATCALTVDATAEAGVYPISVSVKNNTNPDGIVFDEVLTLTVESKPYDLTYVPVSVSLIPMEGHTSPVPTFRAATQAEGTAVTFSLLDDFGVFAIDSATGVVSLPEDTQLVTQTAKTYKLQVKVANSLGTTSFPEAYTVTVDPNKKAEAITSVAYAGTFPVQLKSGEAWTSARPTVTGSTVGIEFSVADAPEGVTIDKKTGVISLAAGHRMPMLAADNFLSVAVRNQGMEAPYTKALAFSVDPLLWKVRMGTNSSANTLTVSGISNMDRISFLGKMWQASASSVQIKLGWGKSSSGSYIDANGGKDPNNSTNVANQNNDWLISEAIAIEDFRINPTVKFTMSFAYGTADNNQLDLYIVEIDAQNAYTYDPATDQEQSQTGTLESTPCNLPWTAFEGAKPIVPTTASGYENYADYAFAIPAAYKGKTVRFALRYWNPSSHANNSRTYRFKDTLRVEDSLSE